MKSLYPPPPRNRSWVFSTALLLSLLAPPTIVRAQSSTSSNSAGQFLVKASQTFSGAQNISSITLTGQLSYYAGSDYETGTITLIGRADGSSSANLQLDSGGRTQIQNTFANGQGCSWSNPDGISHTSQRHNCMLPFAWFLPQVALFGGQLPSIGNLTLATSPSSGDSILSWSVAPPSAVAAEQKPLWAHISAFDLVFDAQSLAPILLSYSAHPDVNAAVDIPVTVQYSNYQQVNGAVVPFHIQKYFNGTLSMDITISSVIVTH